MACPLYVRSKIIMPTIKVRKQANGSTRYTAIVRIRRGTTMLHQESRTFTHRTAALSWAKHREVALEDPAALTRLRHGAPTLAELIRSYIDRFRNGCAARLRFASSRFHLRRFQWPRRKIPWRRGHE
jgi:hypothetical protein